MNDDGIFGYKTGSSTDDLLPYRYKILQRLLENKSGLSIESIATQLTISRAAVQQQFRGLEKEGLIKKHDQMKTNGRPSTRYVLTDRGIGYFPKHYSGLTALLIQSLKDEMGSEQLIDYLKKLGVKLAKTYRPRFVGKSKHEQVKALVELMQEMGFHANIGNAAQAEDTEIRAYNCIYNDVSHKFQEVCAFDTAFIQELLSDFKDQEITLHNCMAKGDGYCCFKLRIEN